MEKLLKYCWSFVLAGLVTLSGVEVCAQGNKMDSLLSLLKTAKEDTNKVNTLNALARELYNTGDYAGGLAYANNGFELATKINFKKGMAKAKNNIGNIYYEQGNYSEALKEHFSSLKIFEKMGDKYEIAGFHNNIGNIYKEQGNYPEALKEYFFALKIREEIGDKKGIADAHNNIGIIFREQGNYPEALKEYFASLRIREEIGDKKGIARSHNNIGNIYSDRGNYPEALKEHFSSLKIKEEMGDKKGISASHSNIGGIFYAQGNYPEALKEYFSSLKIREEIRDKTGVAISHFNIGELYMKQMRTKEGKQEFKTTLEISREIGSKEGIRNSYNGLSRADSALGKAAALAGKWRQANEFNTSALANYKMYIVYRDSLLNEENTKKSVQTQMQFEFDKKEAVSKEQQAKEKVIAEEKNRKQKIITYSVAGGLLLVIVFALFVVRSLRITRGQKQVIELKSKETEEQKKIIEEKNKDITDSINYAKRIQKAMLPHRKDIWDAFPQSFVLFKPKDIVSGDFYFFHKNNQSAFIAAADCTGHGVPGAFMSMIGSGKLNDAVSESADPSVILSLVNKGVKSTLKQSETEQNATRDGMDIALCSVDTGSGIVKYAGANRPLWIIRKGQSTVEEIKATKKAIGGFTEDSQHFESHEIKFEPGDTFYIATDGFADTFGGQEQKKVTTKRFKEILVSIQDKSLNEQGRYLESFIEDWKGGIEQIDDILVIGVRL